MPCKKQTEKQKQSPMGKCMAYSHTEHIAGEQVPKLLTPFVLNLTMLRLTS